MAPLEIITAERVYVDVHAPGARQHARALRALSRRLVMATQDVPPPILRLALHIQEFLETRAGFLG